MQIFNDDCLVKMKEIRNIDAIVTDPPYGINYVSNSRKEKYEKIENDSNLEWLDDFIKLCHDSLNENGVLYCFCSWHNIDTFKIAISKCFNVKNIIVWVKNNTGMGDLKRQYAPKHEFIIFATKGDVFIKGKRTSDVLNFNKTNNENHPTEKPVPLMYFLLSKHDGIKRVLDPFMGSGSTGVACVKRDIEFVGIEKNTTYFNTAKKKT